MFTSLVTKLQQGLLRWNKFQVSFHGKIVIVNHLVASALWFVLTLVAIDSRKLHHLQQMLISFVWSKEGKNLRHKAPEYFLLLPKNRGGLGLINIALQAKVLCIMVFL